MKRLLLTLVLACCLAGSVPAATLVFDQPHDGSGTVNLSSWYSPNGLDGDTYSWDGFTLASATAITEIHWRGGYMYHPSATGQGAISGFQVAIYRSIAGNSQPDMGTGGRLANFNITGTAGETAAGSYGGMAFFDYAYTLSAPFQAQAGVTYWVEIVAAQAGAAPSYAPDWGLATGSGGNGSHFRQITGSNYALIANDLAFSLYTTSGSTVTIAASASPSYEGSVSGAGAYPIGSQVSLLATPNASYGFVNWTENGTQVSTGANYKFTASVNRTLVAHFDTTYGITTASFPTYGGTTSGGGSYLAGSTVTLTATPAQGYVFNLWSDGTTTPVNTFTAAYDAQLTAYFGNAPGTETFDFDSGPYQAPFPLSYTVNGLTATFTGGYSTQAVGTLGIAPAGFSGWCVWPGSIYQSDLGMKFSEPLTDISVLYAVDELACDQSAQVRINTFLHGAFVGTNTTRAPVPGTYPSGTLTFSSGSGFDSVVVHWDAPGSGCQDYGVILFADNVHVTRLAPVGVGQAPGPATPRLALPAPSPFSGSTGIHYSLPRASDVRLCVYDMRGRLVRRLVAEHVDAGDHALRWDGTDNAGRRVSAGVYALALDAGGTRSTRRVMVLK